MFAGQHVGVKEVTDKVWLISFMKYDLGFFDQELGRVTSAENPFEAKVLPARLVKTLPMCPQRPRKFLVAREGIEPPTRGFSVRCSTN